MQQQEETNHKAEPEQNTISLKLIGCLGTVAIVGFLIVITLWLFPLPVPSDNTSTTSGTADDTRIDVATLLTKPEYDTKVRIYGKVSLLGESKSPYFDLTSGGKNVEVWYDSMIDDDGKKRTAVSVKGIKNGDWVVVTGELKKEGVNRALNAFWASNIKKLE